MNNQNITLGALIDMTLEPILRWVKTRLLIAERNSEFKNEEYFHYQMESARKGKADCQARIMRINVMLRDLEK